MQRSWVPKRDRAEEFSTVRCRFGNLAFFGKVGGLGFRVCGLVSAALVRGLAKNFPWVSTRADVYVIEGPERS